MSALDNMNSRERAMVVGGGALALVILFWAMVIDPTVKGRSELASRIETKKKEIVEVRELARKISLSRIKFGALERRMPEPGGSSLLSTMETIATESGIKDGVASMEPQPQVEVEGYSENSVAMRMEKIRLKELVGFLNEVGRRKSYIRVKRLSIKPLYEDPDLLEVKLTVSWYERG
ncbi:MAG: type II secretion system protein M [Nitrospinota bacterium]|nr:type II secretion system protein M [Nitrospinota bacterium]